ncbi:terpene synthase family protein [Sphaerisporangium fuscum]|uniref:terpene synthase family protein n=1 Tax=Sphaerisporangium fuscum TaxID=2835868 RepID=UPI001BDCF47C|nr:terpene synthase family protein [Sphaerisporangium fuscum]
MTAAVPQSPPSAAECGAISALAGRSQRQMRQWTAAHPGLFSAKPFDDALYSTVSMAMAFSGPWYTAEQLSMANKACLWTFALDWLVDYVCASPAEVNALLPRCLAVGDGAEPGAGDDLARMLAEIRQELARAEGFPALGPVWREELQRMLEAMTREWEWKNSQVTPSLEEYLANADNHAFVFVLTCHWIHTGGPDAGTAVGQVRRAARAVQRVMRLLNDLSSYNRDRRWGDVNALLLGVPLDDVTQTVAALTAEARKLLGELRVHQAPLADYMERQMDFCAGFYQIGEFWGRL